MKTVGIVVVTYNAEAFITQCLTSITQQTAAIAHCVVVDNASQDQTIAQVQKHGQVHLIASKENTGFAQGITMGTAYLLSKNCTHIIWWNPDLTAEPTMVEELIKGMEETGVALAQPAILLPDKRTINTTGNALTYVGISYCKDFTHTYSTSENKKILAVSGALLCVTREAYEHIGPLDEDFFLYMEDTDFSWRAFLLGYDAYCIGKSIAYHDYESSYVGKKFYYLERNRLLMLYKNYRKSTLFLLLPILCILEGGLLIFSLLKGVLGWKLVAYRDLFRILPKIRTKRAVIQKNRIRGDHELLLSMESAITPRLFPHWSSARVVNGILGGYYYLLRGIQKR